SPGFEEANQVTCPTTSSFMAESIVARSHSASGTYFVDVMSAYVPVAERDRGGAMALRGTERSQHQFAARLALKKPTR
ncbi:MAG: hypothetical protein NXI32_31415, partial [bacterium]|nr:hypothetical protein [bacterium]